MFKGVKQMIGGNFHVLDTSFKHFQSILINRDIPHKEEILQKERLWSFMEVLQEEHFWLFL